MSSGSIGRSCSLASPVAGSLTNNYVLVRKDREKVTIKKKKETSYKLLFQAAQILFIRKSRVLSHEENAGISCHALRNVMF